MIGIDFEDLGVYSVINCRNTVKASRIVIVNVIFSIILSKRIKTEFYKNLVFH